MPIENTVEKGESAGNLRIHLYPNKFIICSNLREIYGMVESIMGKGENVGYKYFLCFLQLF